MSTRKETAWWLKLLSASFLSLAFAFASPAIAQDEADDEAAADEEDAIEEILVTGSRLKRTTYSSVAPLQIITAEVSREVGLIDPASILQESVAVSGQQIDLSFVGFALDNGPGTSTVSLRGLGSNRTLVLINGRRAAPAGVEGAPFAFSLNLIPGSLVNQYDVLLDGASSVYGSDAVAGVTNIIMRKDFDGLELQAYSTIPQQDEGIRNVLSAVWGRNFDRGFVGVGAEYTTSDDVRFSERKSTAGCEKHYEIDENGVVRTQEQYYTNRYLMRWNECAFTGFPANGLLAYGPSGFDWLLWESEGGNTGISNFSAFRLYSAPADVDQDGWNDSSWIDHDPFTIQRQNHLYPEFEQVSAMAYGEYTLEGERNITPFFEVLFANSKTEANDGSPQLFPWVRPENPYNPLGINGVDPGVTRNNFWMQDGARESFYNYYGAYPEDYGLFWGFYSDAQVTFGPDWVRPVLSIKGDRDNIKTDIEQLRIVAGVRGDLPNWTWGEMSDWTWEFAYSRSKSKGLASRVGIRGDRLNLALGNYAVDGTPCVNDTDGFNLDSFEQDYMAADLAGGCVPVNLFAPNVYEGFDESGQGQLTAAEYGYLLDGRDFDTEYTQQLMNAFVTGTLFEIPSGGVSAGIGFEYRRDELASIADEVAREALLWGYSKDEGASGEKDTKEAFAEIEIPILVGRPLAEELTLNLSTRYTKDEFYGSAWTYSGKIGYRPMDNLLLRATYGTSYRAPNMRENFLKAQTLFASVTDPCRVPATAWDTATNTYDPGGDPRPDYVINNCLADGVDPYSLGGGSVATESIEYARGGTTGLTEETSDSVSAGFVWAQPFWEGFDLTIGGTYYRINVNNTIVEPSPQYIVNDCYYRPAGDSTFCSRISRGSDDLLSFIDAQFLNRDNEKVEGVDVNVAFDKSVNLFGRSIDLGIDLAANRPLERSERFINEDGSASFDDDAGEYGYPTWKGLINLRAEWGNYRFTWATNFIGAVTADADAQPDWSDAWNQSDTCLGPDRGDVRCKNIVDIGKYRLHSASLYYYGDRWTLGAGVRNVFDEDPPRVDFNAPLRVQSGTPIGLGYDINGRTYFINIATKFDY